MSSLETDLRPAIAQRLTLSDEVLSVELEDGRTIVVPISWFPRLSHGTPAERSRWKLIGRGEGISWPDLDEDIACRACCWAGGPASRRSRCNAGLAPEHRRNSPTRTVPTASRGCYS